MSKFNKLSHVICHCQYHIVWVPKYRYRVLKDQVGSEWHLLKPKRLKLLKKAGEVVNWL